MGFVRFFLGGKWMGWICAEEHVWDLLRVRDLLVFFRDFQGAIFEIPMGFPWDLMRFFHDIWAYQRESWDIVEVQGGAPPVM